MSIKRAILVLFLLIPLLAGAQTLSQADKERFEAIKAKHDRGEQLTPEEQQFAQKILQSQRGQGTAQPEALSPADRQRFMSLQAKRGRGEPLTPEEQQFAEKFVLQVLERPGSRNLPGPSDAEREKYAAIQAKHGRGQQLTPEERQFAQQFLLRALQQQRGGGEQGTRSVPGAVVEPIGPAAQQPLSEADRQKFQAIVAKRNRGEALTPEEMQFAQRVFQQRGGQQRGQRGGQQGAPQDVLAGLSETDRRKYEAILAKRERGENVTAEEQQFVQWVRSPERIRQNQSATQPQDYAAAHPARESTGLVPLSELGKGNYKGEQGGLYPGGENTPPPAHLKAGEALARAVVPLDAQGAKSDSGKVVLLSIGMSNTTQEFEVFKKMAETGQQLNPRLVIVDGAQGGQTASVTANPQANFWTVVDERLRTAGVTAKQVQVVWLKEANARPTEPFPAEAQRLKGDLVATLHNLSARFPNLKIAYLSSRVYGGYASTPLNPEPHAYEGAFSVKWVIADQIAGKPEMNHDPAKGQVRAPWVAWGPYLWADGLKARKDGLTYERADLGPDGTHPSFAGRQKVARQLLEFLKKDSTSRGWFVK